MKSIRDWQIFWHNLGISTFPCTPNKHPYFDLLHDHLNDDGKPSWEFYKTNLTPLNEINKMHAVNDVQSYGIACGDGGDPNNVDLFCIDIDNMETAREYTARLKASNPSLHACLYVQKTGKGMHLIARSEKPVGGSCKLAMTEDGKKTLIELKAKGGYILGPGSLHENGSTYTHLEKSAPEPPIIPFIDALFLIELAETFDLKVERHDKKYEPKAEEKISIFEGIIGKPGEDFNRRVSWDELLTKLSVDYGCTLRDHFMDSRGTRFLIRDGAELKRSNYSASINGPYCPDRLFIFSSNVPVLPTGRSLSKFQAYAFAAHGGDFVKAASALGIAGYGNQGKRVISDSRSHPGGGEGNYLARGAGVERTRSGSSNVHEISSAPSAVVAAEIASDASSYASVGSAALNEQPALIEEDVAPFDNQPEPGDLATDEANADKLKYIWQSNLDIADHPKLLKTHTVKIPKDHPAYKQLQEMNKIEASDRVNAYRKPVLVNPVFIRKNEMDDQGLLLRLVALFPGKILWCEETKHFAIWEGNRFVIRNEHTSAFGRYMNLVADAIEIEAQCVQHALVFRHYGRDMAEIETWKQALNKLAQRCRKSSTIAEIRERFKNLPGELKTSFRYQDLDTTPDFLNTPGGVLHLKADGDYQLLRHDPKYKQSQLSNWTPDPTDFSCPTWEKFLTFQFGPNRYNPEATDYKGDSDLHLSQPIWDFYCQWIASLFHAGKNPDSMILVIRGVPGTFKSKAMEIVSNVLGTGNEQSYAAIASKNPFAYEKSNSIDYIMATVATSRSLFVDESNCGKLDDSELGKWSNCVKQTVRPIREAPRTVQTNMRITMVVNNLGIASNESGLERRLIILPWNGVVDAGRKEATEQAKEIPQVRLSDLLESEFSGFFNKYLYPAYQKWRKNNFKYDVPEELLELAQQHVNDSDVFEEIFNELFEIVDPVLINLDQRLTASKAYSTALKLLKEQHEGSEFPSLLRFKEKMRGKTGTMKPGRVGSKTERFYTNLKIKHGMERHLIGGKP